jgi:hypothetical protein
LLVDELLPPAAVEVVFEDDGLCVGKLLVVVEKILAAERAHTVGVAIACAGSKIRPSQRACERSQR